MQLLSKRFLAEGKCLHHKVLLVQHFGGAIRGGFVCMGRWGFLAPDPTGYTHVQSGGRRGLLTGPTYPVRSITATCPDICQSLLVLCAHICQDAEKDLRVLKMQLKCHTVFKGACHLLRVLFRDSQVPPLHTAPSPRYPMNPPPTYTPPGMCVCGGGGVHGCVHGPHTSALYNVMWAAFPNCMNEYPGGGGGG